MKILLKEHHQPKAISIHPKYNPISPGMNERIQKLRKLSVEAVPTLSNVRFTKPLFTARTSGNFLFPCCGQPTFSIITGIKPFIWVKGN